MTIPRLELRSALLGAKLLTKQAQALGIGLDSCTAWTDSQVVIRYLSSSQLVGNDLVDNHINHIQELLPDFKWRYIPTADNRADVATRGTETASLAIHHLWWQGPPWLRQAQEAWPKEPFVQSKKTQISDTSLPLQCLVTQATSTIIDRFSSLLKLLRALVRWRRLIKTHAGRDNTVSRHAPMTTNELQNEFMTCVHIAQQQDFATEIQALRQNDVGPVGSLTARLKPYLDKQNILRVGGRLENSHLSVEEKHPPILSGRSTLAHLILNWAHQRALHSGPTTSSQLIENLSAARVNPGRPFGKIGVDYAGPFHVLRSKERGVSTSKGYVAVFVCLATKAIHLELVGDLTTVSFLGCLTRFIVRRGRPLELWSDNTANFRGANNELKRLFLEAKINWPQIQETLAQDQSTWHFIPPSAPHFGGLWEAGVKSMKRHLHRIGGSRRLTYEEFTTLLVEIEMVLNSRPLIPLSGDLDDLDVLTPGHFLIGTVLTSTPQPDSLDQNLDALTHWKLMRGIRDRF